MTVYLRRPCAFLFASFGLAICMEAGAQAGRQLRVDVDAKSFFDRGQAWNGDTDVDLAGDQQISATLPFDINIGNGATRYDVGFSENGFLSLVARGAPLPSAVAPSGNFVALRAADLGPSSAPVQSPYASFQWGSGLVDTFGSYDFSTRVSTYDLGNAVPAARFTWRNMCLASNCTSTGPGPFQGVSFQAVFLARGNGDFDVELNYAQDGFFGGRGLTLGATTVPLTYDVYRGGQPDYLFRNGSLVPEPTGVTLMLLGLGAGIGWSAWRTRRPQRANG